MTKKLNKFGTFKGVFIPSTEAILGTVLFLLLPTLTGSVGLLPMLIIVVLAHTVTISTSFSLSDCATNLNRIGGGGMYALSRRSLGKAFGGSIGLMLFLAQAFSIAFYCIGFVEPIQPYLQGVFEYFNIFSTVGITDEKLIALFLLRQKQILATIIFLVFFTVVMFGADFTLKIQLFILIILFGSVTAIFISPFLGIKYNGVEVYNSLRNINFLNNNRITIPIFFLTFTQFFPAVTGIDAGVGMSGDLKDPKKSLVKGTFASIGVTFVVYIISTFLFSMMDKNILVTGYKNDIPSGTLLTNIMGLKNIFPFNIAGIMILIGILFATSSSALSCFMTAPRTAQSLCKDGVLPKFLSFIKYDFKKGGKEPRFATLVAFIFAVSIIWIGSINVAAMIVGICFLVVYGWINVSAFFERISGNPTFRPTSKGHWSISLYGFLAVIIAICLFNWLTGLLIIISQLVIFQLILHYKSESKLEGVWWGVLFRLVTRILKSLTVIIQGTKNWRPIVAAIAFSRNSNTTNKLSEMGKRIALHKGLVFMNILETPKSKDIEEQVENYSIPTNIIQLTSNDETQGILSIVQSSHPGNINPNSVLMDYNDRINSLDIVSRTINLKKNMFILKNGEKLENFHNIDIWWRGENNGNLMVLLAYIINNAEDNEDIGKIRIIRKLGKNDNEEKATNELSILLSKGRLSGDVVILPYDEDPITDTIIKVSGNSSLIMIGMPGNINSDGITKIFKIDERFFDKEIQKYDDMPPILFVKSAYLMNLIEDSAG